MTLRWSRGDVKVKLAFPPVCVEEKGYINRNIGIFKENYTKKVTWAAAHQPSGSMMFSRARSFAEAKASAGRIVGMTGNRPELLDRLADETATEEDWIVAENIRREIRRWDLHAG